MTDIVQIKSNNIVVYPQSHAQAILGLTEEIKKHISGSTSVVSGVTSINGKTGSVTLAASDIGALPATTLIPEYSVATNLNDGLLSAEDKEKLDGLPNIKFVKVGTV